MQTYTEAHARRQLAALLNQAEREGAVCIERADGQRFILKHTPSLTSPLAVEGITLGLTADEIVAFIREGRRDADLN